MLRIEIFPEKAQIKTLEKFIEDKDLKFMKNKPKSTGVLTYTSNAMTSEQMKPVTDFVHENTMESLLHELE